MKLKRFFAITLIIGGLFTINACSDAQSKNEETEKNEIKTVSKVEKPAKVIIAPVPDEKKTKDTVTIVGVGDMMLGTHYPKSPNYLPKNNDYDALLAPTVDFLKSADLTFGNCEGTFSTSLKTAKSCNDPKWCYRFCMPEDYVNGFVNAGFDVVSIANNHLGDLGAYGRKRTVEVLEAAGLRYAGLTSCPTDVFTKDGVKYGFCAFAPNQGTCQITDLKLLKKTVEELEKECDIVIVSFHGGAEGRKHEHITRKTEHFLGQNRGNVYEFAHTAIDAGADIVFGHGPHVTRAVEVYKDRFIAYSMGNFCTYRRFSLTGVSGIAPAFKVFTNGEGKFLKAETLATYQDKMTGTKVDPQKRVIKRLQQLVKADFPKSKLVIEDNGDIYVGE